MSPFLRVSERPEVPSRGELWSILLGALVASALLVCAFRLAASARTPLADDESAYRSRTPVIGAAPAPEPSRSVVVKPEPKARARRHHRHRRAAPAALAAAPARS